jgi:hypothetical protein
MFRELTYHNTYHRCNTRERELHQGSLDNSWESSAESVSDTSSVRSHTAGMEAVTRS